jgi:hypothetical protein
MDSSLELLPLTRLLTLNTEINELRSSLMGQPVTGRIADLQDNIDIRRRASLATCWLTGEFELEDEDWEDEDIVPG